MSTETGDHPKVPAEIDSGITNFDPAKLKHAETVEKHNLPSPEVICQEKTLQAVEQFDKDNLKKTETKECNTLPSKEVIMEERRASSGGAS